MVKIGAQSCRRPPTLRTLRSGKGWLDTWHSFIRFGDIGSAPEALQTYTAAAVPESHASVTIAKRLLQHLRLASTSPSWLKLLQWI